MKKIIYSVIMLAMATFTMTSCEDVPAPYGFPEEDAGKVVTPMADPTGTGTEADPYNVAAALTLINGMADGDITGDIWVKGKISTIDGVDINYGNAVYYISDDGTSSNQLQVFRGLFLGGDKFTATDQIKVGDEVIVKGKCKNFKGNTPEFDTGSIIVSLNGKTPEKPQKPDTKFDPAGKGTKADPFNVAAVLQNYYELSNGEYSKEAIYVKGKIVGKPEIDTGSYGNATYSIAQDGSEGDDKLLIFRGFDIDSLKFTDAAKIKEGDEVVIFGKVTKYNGSLQLAQQNYLISINGGAGSSVTKTIDGSTVTIEDKSLSGLTTVGDYVIDLGAQGWTDKQENGINIDTNDYSIAFGKGAGTTTPKYYKDSKGVRLYAKNILTITGKTAKIKKVILECEASNGKVYVGNNELTALNEGKVMTICNDFSTDKGGTQLRVQRIIIQLGN
ncbi:MAG: OB-fold nucleic acid binding domain-containing protein [Prevotella sp.]|uniref:OB-fold nucleic acid binding domain-containing protein n=1 Tax=Prevotella sp. TaxID=59823 RepID=UPI002A26AE03|nr:OB-fold nucleic acid binding domain-containing protein [Prevotella sp.]MDD7317465.1 OB-fold nucleic acid binding domain-containing protein [Prevotellaceae bacterium]MDY4019199.1 OB-fold nucleic acid binding domain-containing protein [Prevotella sp.]